MRAHTRLLIVAAAVIASTIITLPVLTLAGDIFDGGESVDGWGRAPRAASDPQRRGTQLSVCVEGVDVSQSDVEMGKRALESAFEEIAHTDPTWHERHRVRFVDIGCPYPPTISDGGYESGRVVNAPSYYRTFVFVMSEEKLAELVTPDGLEGEQLPYTVFLTAEELICGGDACHQETYGLYLTPGDLNETDRYLNDMYWALYAGHLGRMPGPPEATETPVKAQLPRNN